MTFTIEKIGKYKSLRNRLRIIEAFTLEGTVYNFV